MLPSEYAWKHATRAANATHAAHAKVFRRGSALIVAMWVIVALSGLVLVMAYSVRVEAGAVANRTAQAKVDAAERGAEQFVLSIVNSEVEDPGFIDDVEMEERPIGDCLIWVIRPDYEDESLISYGLLDESARLDLNSATNDMILHLPGMTADVADAITDWRDADSTIRPQGAEDEYYLGLPQPYRAKNGPFESIDELLLVKGVTPEVLYGYDHNRNGIMDDRESQAGGLASAINASSTSARGIAPFVTAWGLVAASSRPAANAAGGAGGSAPVDVNAQNTNNLRNLIRDTLGDARADQVVTQAGAGRPFANVFDFRFRAGLTQDEFAQLFPRLIAQPPTAPGGGQPPTRALVNVNRAPREVLLCLPNMDEADVSAIISKREGSADDPANIAWLAEALTQEKAVAIGGLVTGTSKCFSAEIVAVSGDGRAFKRCRITVDARQAPARISYRKDLTASGWPLSPDLRRELRAGERMETEGSSSMRGVRAL